MRSKSKLSIALCLSGGLVLGSVALAQEEALPACSPAAFQAQLMTPVAGTIPRDAAVVVGLFPGGEHSGLPELKFARGRREMGANVEAIAPGLFRVSPDAARIYGRFSLQGVEGSPELRFGRPGVPAAPPRVELTRVERYRVASGGESRIELRAHFRFPVPDGVIAVLSYFDADDTPDLWSRARPQHDEAVLWQSSGRCPSLPEGASEPGDEGAVRVAFVDQYGQVSQLSEPRPMSR